MNMQHLQVHLTGRLICATEQQADVVRRHLPDHIRLTKDEAGCLSFDITPTDDPLVWTVAECFVDQVAFAFHQRRTRASIWWAKTGHIRRDFAVTGLE